MSKCFVVVHRNYAEGTDAYALWEAKTAEKSVNSDVEVEFRSLHEEGYKPVVLRRESGATVYVPDSDIYYEWDIFETPIEGDLPTSEIEAKTEEPLVQVC